jgi:oligopeptide/dipeptide ABC transporter ATP-binding protein
MVNVADPERRLANYPHQMSGGMKQRVVGAMAIVPRPRVLIADEPTTALDVTIQLQYLNLLKRLQQQTGVSIIFITHDFGVVAKMCDRAAVFYAGRIVEQGTVRKLFNQPAHPYTQALMASVPRIEERVEKLYSIEGTPPALFDLPPGCRFAPRCPHAFARCTEAYPPLFDVDERHQAACWLHETNLTPPAPLSAPERGETNGLLPLSAPERGPGGEVSPVSQDGVS